MTKPNYPFYWISLLFLSFCILFSTYFFISDLIELYQLTKYGKSTTGIINNLSIKTSGDADITVAEIILINNDSAIIERKVPDEFKKGQTINLKYLDNNLKKAKIETFQGIYMGIIASFILLIVSIGGFLLCRSNKSWILKQRGDYWPYG